MTILRLIPILLLLSLFGCKASDLTGASSDDDDSDRSYGYNAYHNESKGGVWHGDDYDHPRSYCASGGCHGDDLLGAQGPSCFSCHGAKWEDDEQDHDAPENHEFLIDGYYHAKDPSQPWGSCDDGDCHGSDLKGGDGPSCFLCHGQKWEDKPSDDDH